MVKFNLILILRKKQTYVPFCHWNVNSRVAHNKMSLLTEYNSDYRYDINYMSESFLDSTISDDDDILPMDRYNLT